MNTPNELYPLRTGRITASRCADMMTTSRGGEGFGETARTYALELALARLGYQVEAPSTWQMDWGLQYESDAREIYEQSRRCKVELPGFIPYTHHAGCVPDGLVADDGMLEIKCPQWKSHSEYLMEGAPKQYWQQMQFQLMCTGRQWCDFMTFHPEFPEGLQARVFRVTRDQDYIDRIEARMIEFEAEIRYFMDKLKQI